MQKTDTGIYIPEHGDSMLVQTRQEKKPEPAEPTASYALDHFKLIQRNRAEIRRFVRLVRKMVKHGGRAMETTIEHTNECCNIERWATTSARLMKLLEKKFGDHRRPFEKGKK